MCEVDDKSVNMIIPPFKVQILFCTRRHHESFIWMKFSS